MKNASLCFKAGLLLFVTFIHGFTVVPGNYYKGMSTMKQRQLLQLDTSILFSKKKRKGGNKGFTEEVNVGPTTTTTTAAAAAAAQKAEATARGLLAARLEMEAKQRTTTTTTSAIRNHAEATDTIPTTAEVTSLESKQIVHEAGAETPPASWTEKLSSSSSEATARALLATRLEMETKQRARNQQAAVTTEIAIEQQPEATNKAEALATPEGVLLEMERKETAVAMRAAAPPGETASAQKAEATARALLTTRLDNETKMRQSAASRSMPDVADGVFEQETKVAETEPTEAVTAVVAEKKSEPKVAEVVSNPVETAVAEPEPVQAQQPESKETVEPGAGALVAVNSDTIEFTSGLIGGAIGFSIGGPVVAAIVASVANYLSRKQDESYSNVIQSISKATIEAFNAVARTEEQLQILKRSKKALEGSLESLKKSDGVDPEAIQQVEDTLAKVTGKLAELNEELDPIGAALVALKAIGDLIEKIFDAAGEVNREYELTDRATSSIKEAVEKTKSGLN